jgi:hypothetical protein
VLRPHTQVLSLSMSRLLGWPPNGRVCNSEHPYDKVIDADIKPELDWQTMTPRRDRHSWRSPRRMAISALSDMGNYQ